MGVLLDQGKRMENDQKRQGKDIEQPLQLFLETHRVDPVKLHLGCGGERLAGFVNVDFYPHDPAIEDSSRSGCVADAFADMRHLGLVDHTVAEIFTAHTVEHFTRWEAIDMFRDWHRMCVPGGRVVIETPRFWSCVLGLLIPIPKLKNLARSQFYGNQQDRLDYETHRYVWGGAELCNILRELGFSRVSISWRPKTHCKLRDMRIIAIKSV